MITKQYEFHCMGRSGTGNARTKTELRARLMACGLVGNCVLEEVETKDKPALFLEISIGHFKNQVGLKPHKMLMRKSGHKTY